MLLREIRRIYHALGYSLEGLKAAFKEPSFRTEICFAIILIPLALYLPVDKFCKVFLIESMLLVLIVELINISLEESVNYISKDKHPLAKKIKDIASASVFVCLINAFGMWIWALSQILDVALFQF